MSCRGWTLSDEMQGSGSTRCRGWAARDAGVGQYEMQGLGSTRRAILFLAAIEIIVIYFKSHAVLEISGFCSSTCMPQA